MPFSPVPLQTAVDHAARTREGGVPLPLSERKVLLFIVDTLLLELALLTVLALRMGRPFAWQTIAERPVWFVLPFVVWAAVALIFHIYDLRRAGRVRESITDAGTVALLTSAIYLAIPYVTPYLITSRLTAGLFILLTVLLVTTGRLMYAALVSQPAFRYRALIVGAGWAGRAILDVLRTHAATEYDPVGFIDDDPAKRHVEIDGLPVLGNRQDLTRLVDEARVSEIIVAITHPESMDSRLVQALLECRERGFQVTLMPSMYERLTGKVPVEHAGRGLHVILPLEREPGLVYPALKRAIDITLGLLGVGVLTILYPLVAPAIWLGGRGSVFYRQVRIGLGGRSFPLLKFRTMVLHAEAGGPQWAQEGDARITRVGTVLRRLHIDEIPQALNLLRGDMSFVGPRPERPEFVAELEQVIPFYRVRHAVRPGITGWAQVNYRYGSSVEDAFIKLQYDLYYIKRCSLMLDLQIIARTIGLVLRLQGR